MVDSSGRIYNLKMTTCILCGIEVTYTHKRPFWCKECRILGGRIRAKVWRHDNLDKAKENHRKKRVKAVENRRLKIDAIKMESGCVDCGYNLHPAALDFDHIVGDKLFNISDHTRRNIAWQKIEEEIAKCEVVCANCHRIRTFNRINV